MRTSDLAGKRLLILDGTRLGCELVEQAQALGVRAIVADYNSPENAPAKQIADEHLLVSITDVDAVVDVARRERIDGVLAGFSDKILPYYAEICRRSGLPCYGTTDLFRLFTNKAAYKKLCREHGVPTVESYSLDEFEDGADRHVRYPVLVKPVDGSGSRGIVVCESAEQTRRASAEIIDCGTDIVIERFHTGEEATVFWVFQDGEYHVSMLANRHIERYSSDTPPLPIAYTAPSSLAEAYLQTTAPKVANMLRESGVRDGMMFMQGMVDDGAFRVYDIGYRVTGTQEYRLIDKVSGFNPLSMLIRFALTGSMGEPELASKADPRRTPYSINVSISMRPGTVGELVGLDAVRSLRGVVAVVPARVAGETLPEDAVGQLSQIAVRVHAIADTIEELEALSAEIERTIRIIGDEGSDLTLPVRTAAGYRRRLQTPVV